MTVTSAQMTSVRAREERMDPPRHHHRRQAQRGAAGLLFVGTVIMCPVQAYKKQQLYITEDRWVCICLFVSKHALWHRIGADFVSCWVLFSGGFYVWPSLAEVNTRARRFVSAWMRHQKREESKLVHLLRVRIPSFSSQRIPPPPSFPSLFFSFFFNMQNKYNDVS